MSLVCLSPLRSLRWGVEEEGGGREGERERGREKDEGVKDKGWTGTLICGGFSVLFDKTGEFSIPVQ